MNGNKHKYTGTSGNKHTNEWAQTSVNKGRASTNRWTHKQMGRNKWGHVHMSKDKPWMAGVSIGRSSYNNSGAPPPPPPLFYLFSEYRGHRCPPTSQHLMKHMGHVNWHVRQLCEVLEKAEPVNTNGTAGFVWTCNFLGMVCTHTRHSCGLGFSDPQVTCDKPYPSPVSDVIIKTIQHPHRIGSTKPIITGPISNFSIAPHTYTYYGCSIPSQTHQGSRYDTIRAHHPISSSIYTDFGHCSIFIHHFILFSFVFWAFRGIEGAALREGGTC